MARHASELKDSDKKNIHKENVIDKEEQKWKINLNWVLNDNVIYDTARKKADVAPESVKSLTGKKHKFFMQHYLLFWKQFKDHKHRIFMIITNNLSMQNVSCIFYVVIFNDDDKKICHGCSMAANDDIPECFQMLCW